MVWRPGPWLVAAACGAALFFAAFLLRPFDEEVGRAIVGAPGLFTLAGGLAFLGGAAFVGPLLLVVGAGLAVSGRPWGGLRLALVLLAAEATSRGLKLVFARPRPEFMLVETGGFSFPSGHATTGAALAVLLVWFASRHLRARWVFVAAVGAAASWALGQAVGRLVLGVHYLSDVVAGVGTGVAVASLVLAGTLLVERRVPLGPRRPQ